ncbi:ABC transporter permease [Anaerocolumna cellulosilytica]|uniref:ABC transporter permease n=1 Tax=Anaerocolumna cellulosilytica TaxID=433286 RepID=A0A6S6R9F0_9FIRM|nr:ABC transporter permease subunit [Anaerocolumna cellulosilytica]MBB5196832.1 ABC-2 type transport system permease protein [Anaerocolumna cellulosilytica]BCJ95775.1 ABC transporter permease [Anaerocolumna cellulosilytica]
MFKGLVINEFVKLFSKKKTYIILALFVLLSGVLVYVSETQERNYLKYNSPEYRISNLESEISYQQTYVSGLEENETEDVKEEIISARAYLTSLEEQLEQAKLDLEVRSEFDWREYAKERIENIQADLEDESNQDSKAYLEQELERLTMSLEHNVRPDDESYNTGINYYVGNIILVASVFLAFGLILFNADCVSNEYNPATLKFLLIQPVSRIKVLLSKYIVMLFSSLGLIMLTQFVFFLGVGLVKGFGSFARPMLVGVQYEYIIENGKEVLSQIMGSGHYISLSEYLLRGLFLQGLFIVVMVTFIFMISTLVKSSVVSITVAISTILGTNIVYMLSTTYRRLSAFIFLQYTEIEGILSGRIISYTGSLAFTLPTVIIVSVISTVVFLTISLVVFKKRDIQI